jgi:hypothetical protein
MGTKHNYDDEYDDEYEKDVGFEKYNQKRRRKTFKEHRRSARLKKQQQRDKGLAGDEQH